MYSGSGWSAPVSVSGAHDLTSVSCPSTFLCVAVDGYGNASTFNGVAWSSATLVTGSAFAGLMSVSCPTSMFCMALDNRWDSDSYDGTLWQYAGSLAGTAQKQLSCSSSLCVAVDSGGNTTVYSGGMWGSTTAIDSGGGGLTAISCATASSCIALDADGNALSYDGSPWSTPESVDHDAGLASMSCPTASFCMAIDDAGNELTDTSGVWSTPSTVDPLGGGLINQRLLISSLACHAVDALGTAVDDPGSSAPRTTALGSGGLTSVSCPSSSFCTAIDWNGGARTYDGSVWSSRIQVEPSGYGLAAVSCPSPQFCAAVDERGDALAYGLGGWGAAQRFDPHGEPDAISCPSPRLCVAVDLEGNAFTFSNGSWGAGIDVDAGRALVTVSCPSTSLCAAADPTGYVVLDRGGSWSTPTVVDGQGGLADVSCAPQSSCWAVGGKATWHYDGTGWSSASTESPGSLQTVSCSTTTTFCASEDDAGSATTYDGNAWPSPTVIEQPALTEGTATISPSVSCASAGFCVSVDGYSDAASYSATIPPPPINTAPPTISGNPAPGQTLTALPGSWTNAPTAHAYQWQQCDGIGANCAPIAGASSQTYTVTAAELGSTVRVLEWATDTGGTGGPAPSAPTPRINGATGGPTTSTSTPPVNSPPGVNARAGAPIEISPPRISGRPNAGLTLIASTGAWTAVNGARLSYAYQWQRCHVRCSDIRGADRRSYTLLPSDLGANIRVIVTATEIGDGAQATSSTSGPVGPVAPSTATIREALDRLLVACSRSTSITRLLRGGNEWITFAAPSPGRLVITWHVPNPRPNGHRTVAALTGVQVRRSHTILVRLSLAHNIRAMLAGHHRLSLTVAAEFAPHDEANALVHASRSFFAP